MRLALTALAILLCGTALEAKAQCRAPVITYYGGYAGYAPYGAYYARYPGYVQYQSYVPFRAAQPSFPMEGSSASGVIYGPQSTYFRGAPGGPFAPPGGTFFGGYDYQLSYPTNWFGGYWNSW
jgi:hypothetical protein